MTGLECRVKVASNIVVLLFDLRIDENKPIFHVGQLRQTTRSRPSLHVFTRVHVVECFIRRPEHCRQTSRLTHCPYTL
jgi:hypothetical protein